MIFVLKSGKFKQTHYTSADKLVEVFELDGIEDAPGLNRQLAKGNHVYCWQSPFQYEINGKKFMHWGLDQEIELRDFHRSNEEV